MGLATTDLTFFMKVYVSNLHILLWTNRPSFIFEKV